MKRLRAHVFYDACSHHSHSCRALTPTTAANRQATAKEGDVKHGAKAKGGGGASADREDPAAGKTKIRPARLRKPTKLASDFTKG